MPEYAVRVGVATARPPGEHATVWVLVEADSATGAQLVAAQLASANPAVVMPVSTHVVRVTL